MHTALSFPVLGEDVLITGAGPIGLMAIPVVRHAGARHVVVTVMNPLQVGPGIAEVGRNCGCESKRMTPIAEVQKQLGRWWKDSI